MRLALIIGIGIHAIIHVLGFLKAFGIAEIHAISQPISRLFGIVWLLAFVLFAVSAFLLAFEFRYWWAIGTVGVLVSQILIITYWSDTKYGTVLNLIILVPILFVYSSFSFKQKVNGEIAALFENSNPVAPTILTDDMISDVPEPVQKWLLNSGAVGKEAIFTVYLEQDLQLLMNPDQKDWSPAVAKQYFTTHPPAFNWSLNLKMNSRIDVVGRDKFENGKGEMTIKLFSLFPIANAKNDEKVNQATLQRFLAEIVWFPSAALNPFITWKSRDEYTAEATMEFNGTKGSGVFHFDENGNFRKFVAMRYKDAKDVEPTEWTVTATKTEERNGIKIPVESEAAWKLENGNWTWLKLKITAVKYNEGDMTDRQLQSMRPAKKTKIE